MKIVPSRFHHNNAIGWRNPRNCCLSPRPVYCQRGSKTGQFTRLLLHHTLVMFCDVPGGALSLTGLCRLIELQGAQFGFVVLTQHQLLFYLQRMNEKGEKNGSLIAPQTSCTAFKVTVQLSRFYILYFLCYRVTDWTGRKWMLIKINTLRTLQKEMTVDSTKSPPDLCPL